MKDRWDMELPSLVVFLSGLVVIVVGAELLLRGASRTAAQLGVRPMVIGLTVVSVATSLPELAVGIVATKEGSGSLAIGNIAGTNIFNILFILGLSAAIRPLPLKHMSLRLDVPVMIAAAVAIVVMSLDGELGRIDGILLVMAAVVYYIAIVRLSRRERAKMRKEYAEEYSESVLLGRKNFWSFMGSILFLLVGIALTIFGADLMVSGAVDIARLLGVSDAIIGLTIVAIGTSAPELATTMVATIKDDRDVAVGNLVGSSISNILLILGVVCVVAPQGLEVSRDILMIDLPLAAAVAIACYPVFRSGQRVSRTEGIVFLSLYILYTCVLIFIRA
ncbi:MAG TPA: calcium/sodium antiporter [Cyclobacteriaceae bacterium]|nr:calcium/sodium antiporter [Cyclobacteriaceae bacterium]